MLQRVGRVGGGESGVKAWPRLEVVAGRDGPLVRGAAGVVVRLEARDLAPASVGSGGATDGGDRSVAGSSFEPEGLLLLRSF